MKWTLEQQKVIDLRNKNILVSAAAGSGKTAVLVERIISMITEGTEPIDIDRLLIVTFTNAAAAEMRERIGKAIEKKIEEMPDNKHLQKQMTLIHSAQITTIHSFCLSVIRNYFNTINLDPSFRIADEAELTLLKSDVLAELLENYYEEGKEEFLEFIENFSSGKSDAGIEELVLNLHNFSMSYPWPEEWLNEKKNAFTITSLEEMNQSDWMKALIANLESVIDDMKQRCEEAIAICEEADGPSAYIPALQSDLDLLEDLVGLKDFIQYDTSFSGFTFARLSGKKEEGVSDDKKNQVKLIRDDVKKALGDLKKNYFFQTPEEMLSDIQEMQRPMSVLVDLTKDFGTAFAEKKADKNLVDFNDLEHFALNILVNKVGGMVKPTPVADELSEHYIELLVDEYQDSNFVQETILNSISSERFGKPNLFMVGDVKQSIYKFRLARPEIFMEKYDHYKICETYQECEKCDCSVNQHQRVDLHKNFRSREVVLDSINFIFEQIMTKKLGNIAYDSKVALYPGADFGVQTEQISKDTEIILVSVDPTIVEENNDSSVPEMEDSDNSKEEEEYTAKEIEAKAIAKRMKELTDPVNGLKVKDKKGDYRIANYGDIVILLRTMSNWAEIFADTLAAEGIPAFTETQSGYFSTLEIRTILNLLKIIDNPRQDIPFTAILRSPIVGLTSNELAAIRIPRRKISMYEAVIEYVGYGEDSNNLAEVIEDSINLTKAKQEITKDDSNILSKDELKVRINSTESIVEESKIEENKIEENKIEVNKIELDNTEDTVSKGMITKLNVFLDKLIQYRNMVHYFSIHELILKVLEDTNYYNFASAMPSGEKRKANIDMLVQRAVQFENTSFSGLFHFIRYIEKLNKYDIDFGEAKLVSENDNTVKIMSIHKSKGLEFPVVFVAGMGKNFNNQDSRGKLLIHPDLGIGPDYVDYQLRIKAPTLIKKVIQKELVLENLGEELRVLYVAMTRAKEKLILTGGVKKLADKIIKWGSICQQKDKQLLYYQLSTAGTYLDWVVPATMRNQGFESILVDYGIYPDKNNPLYHANTKFSIQTNSYDELAKAELMDQIIKNINQEELNNWDNSIVYNKEIQSEIEARMKYEYPYERETNIHTKLTVSELKKLGQLEAEDFGVPISAAQKQNTDIPVPNFIKHTENIKKSELGTLYHKILEQLDLLKVRTREDINAYFEHFATKNQIQPNELELIDKEKIYHFLTNPITERMRKAKEKGKFYTERQFVMGLKANEINRSFQSNELVLIQGVIDVYFEEEDQWILLDYKTDHVDKNNGEELLKKRYHVQLEYYQKALEQLTGKKVKEKIIYSFELEKQISL